MTIEPKTLSDYFDADGYHMIHSQRKLHCYTAFLVIAGSGLTLFAISFGARMAGQSLSEGGNFWGSVAISAGVGAGLGLYARSKICVIPSPYAELEWDPGITYNFDGSKRSLPMVGFDVRSTKPGELEGRCEDADEHNWANRGDRFWLQSDTSLQFDGKSSQGYQISEPDKPEKISCSLSNVAHNFFVFNYKDERAPIACASHLGHHWRVIAQSLSPDQRIFLSMCLAKCAQEWDFPSPNDVPFVPFPEE